MTSSVMPWGTAVAVLLFRNVFSWFVNTVYYSLLCWIGWLSGVYTKACGLVKAGIIVVMNTFPVIMGLTPSKVVGVNIKLPCQNVVFHARNGSKQHLDRISVLERWRSSPCVQGNCYWTARFCWSALLEASDLALPVSPQHHPLPFTLSANGLVQSRYTINITWKICII